MRKPKFNSDPLHKLRVALREFAAARDWDQFHSPKNLATALSVEASELLEHFQWLTEKQSSRLQARELRKVREEMADVLLYLIRLADKLEIDMVQAALNKMRSNAKKYPVAKARGISRKYTEL